MAYMAHENNNKIPCGGFYLGDGLTMDGNTLKSLGEKQVQTDWNQNDTAAKDYIKNRPGGYTKTTPGYEITWDGSVGDKVVVDGGEMQLVKVSDRVFTVEELIGSTMIFGDQSITINNDKIQSQNGVIMAGDAIFVCTTPITIYDITIPEAGTYFAKTREGFVSFLSKPDSTTTVKIPAELTTVVGGYDAAERTAVIFDGMVKASDFTERSVSGVSYYFAPIALIEDLVEGATVSGTINGVQVSGTVKAGYVHLYAIAQVSPSERLLVADIGGDAGNYQIALEKQPESDLTIHLTQTAPAHAVTIPEEYLELTETNAAISAAMSAANTAQSAASSAQTMADTAKTTADTAKTTADTAKTTADTAKTTAKNAVHGTIQRLPNITSLNYSLTPSDETADSIDSVHTYIGWSGGSDLGIIVKDKTHPSVTFTPPAYLNHQADFAFARGTNAYPHPKITEIGGIVMYSTTSGSTKKFLITVDDTGTIKATEVTNN